jgi:hypothetical protein
MEVAIDERVCGEEVLSLLWRFESLHLPYRRARVLLEDFFPIGDPVASDTIQQRTLRGGARLEREAARRMPAQVPVRQLGASGCRR